MSHNLWSLLTGRGRAFLLIGAAVTISAVLLGSRDLLWLGVFLIALPLVSLAIVARTRLRLACERRMAPTQVVVGDVANGELVLTKSGNLPTGILRFEDSLPVELGNRPRFTVHQFSGAWRRHISYSVVARARGRYRTGPLLVRATDPFSLVKLDRRFSATSDLLVTPAIEPLPAMRNAAGVGVSGDVTPQKIGAVGPDDVLIREYRSGDDVRRIHWRSTARRGEIMVRREEQAWDPAASVLLDSRASRHGGKGPASSFEWAVSAATSIAVHFLDAGFRVDVFDADGTMAAADAAEHPAATRQNVIYQMTEVQLTQRKTLVRAADSTGLRTRGQLMIAVTGRLVPADVEQLVRAQRNRSRAFALVLDVDTFATRSERGSDKEMLDHKVALRMLRDRQWRVLEVVKGTSVNEAWQTLDMMGDLD